MRAPVRSELPLLLSSSLLVPAIGLILVSVSLPQILVELGGGKLDLSAAGVLTSAMGGRVRASLAAYGPFSLVPVRFTVYAMGVELSFESNSAGGFSIVLYPLCIALGCYVIRRRVFSEERRRRIIASLVFSSSLSLLNLLIAELSSLMLKPMFALVPISVSIDVLEGSYILGPAVNCLLALLIMLRGGARD